MHVTISSSYEVLEVLQHHLRPLSYCKAVKGEAFHGGNTGSNPVGDANHVKQVFRSGDLQGCDLAVACVLTTWISFSARIGFAM